MIIWFRGRLIEYAESEYDYAFFPSKDCLAVVKKGGLTDLYSWSDITEVQNCNFVEKDKSYE